VIALSIACSVAIASAQDAPAAEAYDRGLAALEAGDTDGALRAFREAFEVEPIPEHALAVAATLQEREALGEAIGLYDRLLAGELGPLTPAQIGAIAEARARASERQAVLTVTVEGARELPVELDGAVVGSVAAGAALTLRVDPGEHRVTGPRAEEPIVVTVGASERAAVRLRVASPPSPSPRIVERATRPADDGAPPWPWIVLGTGGALLVAGAILAAVLLTGDAAFSEAPIENVTALRF
jgi:hypothetical protein